MTDHTADPLLVARSTLIRASLGSVWSALTTPESFARWYAFGGASIDLRPGGAIRLHWEEHGTFLGRVEAVEEPLLFSYRLAVTPDTEPTPTNSTLVEFRLEPLNRKTRLSVTESGYDQLDPEYGLPADLPTLAGQGWEGGFTLLRGLLEVPA